MADVYVATDGSDSNGGTSIGDAYATLQTANDDVGLSAGDTVWLVVKTDQYGVPQRFTADTGTITLDTSGSDSSGGSIKWRATNASGVVDGTMAIVDFDGESLTAGGINIQAHHLFFQNIGVENTASGSTGEGWLDTNSGGTPTSNGANLFFYGCSAYNCGDDGFDTNSRYQVFYQCYSGHNSGASDSGFRLISNEDKWVIGCIAENNGQDGFNLSHDASCFYCIANNNATHGFRDPKRAINCTSAYNSDSGFYSGADSDFNVYINNIVYGNGSYAFELNPLSTRSQKLIAYNAVGGNTSGTYDTPIDTSREVEIHTTILTEDPFRNADYRDFSLNGRAGGGALCLNAGTSGVGRFTNTRDFIDLGAIQSQRIVTVS